MAQTVSILNPILPMEHTGESQGPSNQAPAKGSGLDHSIKIAIQVKAHTPSGSSAHIV